MNEFNLISYFHCCGRLNNVPLISRHQSQEPMNMLPYMEKETLHIKIKYFDMERSSWIT